MDKKKKLLNRICIIINKIENQTKNDIRNVY